MGFLDRAPLRGRVTQLSRLPLLAVLATSPAALAAEGQQPEEMIVTGSYIRGSAEDAALPIAVVDQQDLLDQGSPNLIDMVRNLNVSSGNIGESQQARGGAQGTEGVATINLRGLGSSRTLVLINGHRTASTESIGTDLSIMPSSAIGRLEVLKDGAAALYGSDAIGGVVNLITRSGFEGFEVKASNNFIEGSNGESEFSTLFGWAGEKSDFLFAFEFNHRSELTARDRDWALRPFVQNNLAGWSGNSGPGPIQLGAAPNPAGTLQPNGAPSAANTGPDPQCDNLLGKHLPTAPGGLSGTCLFQIPYWDNLVEPQDSYKAYAEYNYTINDNHTLHLEGMYALVSMQHFKTSPSYAANIQRTPDRYIAPDHPGLVSMRRIYDAANLAYLGGVNRGVYAISRYAAANGFFGDPQQGTRQTDTYRFGGSLKGSLFQEAIDYDFAVHYSKRDRNVSGKDMLTENYAFALDGLGGPNCNRATGTPGVGGCEYFNPFSNAIQQSAMTGAVNPDYDASVANSPEMLDWLVGRQRTHAINELLNIDFVVSGETPISLDGGPVAVAVGMQTRKEKYTLETNDLVDIERNPCPFRDPLSITLGNVASLDCLAPGGSGPGGLVAFLGPTFARNESRTIYAFFAEVKLPFSDTVDSQAAIRFEDYGGSVGSTIDPKFAIRWQATDWLALRGSISTTFRAPPQSSLSGRGTALQSIPQAGGQFRAVDVNGNPGLKPETAVATNFGAIIDAGGLFASVDYWKFDFEDPIISEGYLDILNTYARLQCQDGGAGAATPDCVQLRSHVFPLGTALANTERVTTNVINGSDISTSGVDFFVQYDFDEVFGGELSVGGEVTYTIEYEVGPSIDIGGVLLAPGLDVAGFINKESSAYTAKPKLKGSLFTRYVNGSQRAMLTARYVDEYQDRTPPAVNAFATNRFENIDQHLTFDFTYSVGLMDDKLNLSATVANILDNDPPRTAEFYNFDAYTHNPLGRTFKVSFTYTGGELF